MPRLGGDKNGMSRLAKKPILFPEGVTVESRDGVLVFKGSRGERQIKILPGISVEVDQNSLKVNKEKNFKQSLANLGTMASLIKSAIEGVTQGFSKILEIEGVGFKAAIEGKTLILNLGFSNPIRFNSPEGITITAEKNVITISGIDKQAVGLVAAKIRSFRKPEPYKGKGIRYQGEVIRRKAGKKAVASAG